MPIGFSFIFIFSSKLILAFEKENAICCKNKPCLRHLTEQERDGVLFPRHSGNRKLRTDSVMAHLLLDLLLPVKATASVTV